MMLNWKESFPLIKSTVCVLLFLYSAHLVKKACNFGYRHSVRHPNKHTELTVKVRLAKLNALHVILSEKCKICHELFNLLTYIDNGEFWWRRRQRRRPTKQRICCANKPKPWRIMQRVRESVLVWFCIWSNWIAAERYLVFILTQCLSVQCYFSWPTPYISQHFECDLIGLRELSNLKRKVSEWEMEWVSEWVCSRIFAENLLVLSFVIGWVFEQVYAFVIWW